MARFAPLQLALAMAVVVAAAVVGRSQDQDQDQAQEQQRFRAGVNTVYVPVTVTDAAGRFVRTLNREDFVIRDNGQPQEITIFDREYRTVSAVILMDASASMLPAFDRVLTAANDFIVRLMPGDEARIGSFAEEVRISPDFTGDRDALLAIFANEFNVRIGRRTRLWDAMAQAIEHLARADSRRVIIVITDGVDTFSSRTFDDVNGLARRHDVAVFVVHVEHGTRGAQRVELSVGPDGSGPGRRRPEPDFVVETIARETGGGFVSVDAAWAHMTPATDIMLGLHSAYLLGFTPAELDDTVHQLDVSVRARSLRVKARRSYLATADAGRDGGGS